MTLHTSLMRLLRRRRPKAVFTENRIDGSDEALDFPKRLEEIQSPRLPAGGQPCICRVCKFNLPSTNHPDDAQDSANCGLKHVFGTVTVGTQTVSIHHIESQTNADTDNEYLADNSPRELNKKFQDMASQTSHKEDNFSNEAILERSYNTDDEPNKRKTQYKRKASRPKTDHSENYRNEPLQQKSQYNENRSKSIWRRPTIVVYSNKFKQNDQVKFVKKEIVIDYDDETDQKPPEPLAIQHNINYDSPNNNKLDELVHQIRRLQHEIESHEHRINQLMSSINMIEKPKTKTMDDKNTQANLPEGPNSTIVQSDPGTSCASGQLCRCETLFEQFLRIFSKPEENPQSNDLISICEDAKSRELNEQNCPRSRIFDLDILFREFMRLFMKPKQPDTVGCDDDNEVIHSLCRPCDPPLTVGTCSKDLNSEMETNCSKTYTTYNKLTCPKKRAKKRSSNLPAKLGQCPCPSRQISGNNANDSNSLLKRQQSSLCQFCGNINLPVLNDLVNELTKLTGKRGFKDIVLTVLLRADNIYHVNVRDIETGRVLGCLLVNDGAIDDAISRGLFDNILTYCVIDARSTIKPKDRPFGIPFEFIHADRNKDYQREQGGECDNLVLRDIKTWEFAVKVLGLPMEYSGKIYSLTNAVKLVNQKSHYQLRITSRPLKRRQQLRSGEDEHSALGNTEIFDLSTILNPSTHGKET